MKMHARVLLAIDSLAKHTDKHSLCLVQRWARGSLSVLCLPATLACQPCAGSTATLQRLPCNLGVFRSPLLLPLPVAPPCSGKPRRWGRLYNRGPTCCLHPPPRRGHAHRHTSLGRRPGGLRVGGMHGSGPKQHIRADKRTQHTGIA